MRNGSIYVAPERSLKRKRAVPSPAECYNKTMATVKPLNLRDLKATLRSELPSLRKTYSVKRLSLFGSTVRGEGTARSDIDLLVEFRSPIGLIKFMELENRLSVLLGKRVDLVMKSALKPRIGRQILKEAIPV